MSRYGFEFGSAMAFYGVSVALSSLAINTLDLGAHGAIYLSLVPMPATVVVAWVVWRNLKRMDELQKRVQVEAIGLAFALTALVTFNYGFLEMVGFPRQSAFWVWTIMAACWVLSSFLVKRRY
ncbi:hypothetical protein TRP8649_00820 [Pelagimonas phthalicica]|uniref:Uncharacterized protein n=1 Tax=Pelagimonas phthalicica TaxID=1037362 RepID=A0A238J8M2_9RHOB|nr:hypothetical protein [Pelagimonas phthalicica]TDS94737.1 hypothetical protein CLV87_1251 [Pelagimonas phthalicica]SMX26735.1 hypothetical protein TRP8649_00820 [Pelagimonas phthalicica]